MSEAINYRVEADKGEYIVIGYLDGLEPFVVKRYTTILDAAVFIGGSLVAAHRATKQTSNPQGKAILSQS